MRKASKVEGRVGRVFNGTEIVVLGTALNNNADMLDELWAKVQKLEKRCEETKSKESEDKE